MNILINTCAIGFFLGIILRYCFKKYKQFYGEYDKKFTILVKDVESERNLRNEIEKKLKCELQKTYELRKRLFMFEERLKLLDEYRKKYEKLHLELDRQIGLNHTQELLIKELNVRLEEYKLTAEEKQKLFLDSERRLTTQFENLANRIFEQNGYKIEEQNRSALDRILIPFKKQLKEFENQVENNFFKEEQMRNSLTYEIRNLYQLNSKITQETINLTKALKGNNKMQGNWGEVILTRVLEASGMREGHEFDLQLNFKQSDGRRMQPDVIVHLPNNKDVIIDSKVSLLAYERYFNSDNKQDKKLAIIEHIQSLRSHIKLLSKKNYQKLFGLYTLDYILMFIPIESAFTLAIEEESFLLTYAMQYNIMLVSPATLLVALRTINNLWCYERQNDHAKKIADKAGRLYDKLRLFIDDLNKIGQYLNKAETVYNSAKNKFSEGKGNIISQAESFRELGVQIKQPIVSDDNQSNVDSIFLISSKKERNCFNDSTTHNENKFVQNK